MVFMTTKQNAEAERAASHAILDAAYAAAKMALNTTSGEARIAAMEAAKLSYNARTIFAVPMKPGPDFGRYTAAGRSGRRQHAEMNAMRQDALRRRQNFGSR